MAFILRYFTEFGMFQGALRNQSGHTSYVVATVHLSVRLSVRPSRSGISSADEFLLSRV